MLRRVYLLVFLLIMTGCASIPEAEQDPRDPLQSVNRPIYDFNFDILDEYIVRPAAVGYVNYTPKPVRKGLVNFTSNLDAPINSVNSLLQGKFAYAGINAGRFLINSTVGLLGVFDVATEIGLEAHDEDFGQTLGVWGVGDGAYLMVPAQGPSTVRNFSGDVVDNLLFPNAVLTTPQSILLFVIRGLETRAELLAQDSLLDDSLDPYSLVKDIYFQRQLSELYDGEPPIQEEDDEDLDEFFDELD